MAIAKLISIAESSASIFCRISWEGNTIYNSTQFIQMISSPTALVDNTMIRNIDTDSDDEVCYFYFY